MFKSSAKRMAKHLWRRFGLPAPATKRFRFVRLALPSGREYELSVENENADTYHAAASTGELADGTWRFLHSWIRPGDVFFDLGANIGVFAVPAGVKGAQVHAFELLHANADHLARAAERNALQEFHIVVGPVSDRATFLSTFGASAWAETKADGTTTFPSVVIDDYVREKSIGRVDVMKIDIEGSEKSALAGARGTIERDHPDIVIECNALTCGNHGYSYRELLGMLTAHGYRIYRIGDPQLAPWRPDSVQEMILADYFATVKPPDETETRGELPIRDLTDAQMLDSLIAQNAHSAFHKQYALLILDRLPPRLREDEAVRKLTAQWKPLSDEQVLAVLRRGSA